MSNFQPNKRPASQTGSGAARKKSKIQHARQITVEPPAAQLARASTVQAQAKLPEFLDVEKFLNSRAFEISAMERAMKTAREAGCQRAFQSLPRHLRRRAASHFARRLPTRLRSKAKFEMMHDKKRIPSRSVKAKLRLKAYLNEHRTERLRNRQVEKAWLATHVWHAKRTKMIDIWGFRLAKTPTEKCYRSTYRAAQHGSTIHDQSYMSQVTLSGNEDMLARVLDQICDPLGPNPCSIKFKPGHREVNINMYEFQSWPYGFIGPASIIWCPVQTEAELDCAPPLTQEIRKPVGRYRGRKKSGRGQRDFELARTDLASSGAQVIPILQPASSSINPLAGGVNPAVVDNIPIHAEGQASVMTHDLTAAAQLASSQTISHDPQPKSSDHTEPTPLSNLACSRTVLLQVHPAIKDQVLDAIRSASQGLELALAVHEDLGSFELTGPRSTEVLGRVLEGEFGEGKGDVMRLLRAGIAPSVFPSGMVIGLLADDPRVHFPPRKRKPISEDVGMKVIEPHVDLARCQLFWNSQVRKRHPQFKKSHIDKRREEQTIPGTRLRLTEEDDRIAILLVRSGRGWKVLLPKNWTQAFLVSLVYAGPRLVCLDQRAQLSYEAGQRAFPNDFPGLGPYNEIAQDSGAAARSHWERRPPAKRVNYAKLGEEDPFVADWMVACGQAPSVKTEVKTTNPKRKNKKKVERENHLIPTAAEVTSMSKDVATNSVTADPSASLASSAEQGAWLLSGPVVGVLIDSIRQLATKHPNQPVEGLVSMLLPLFEGIVKEVRVPGTRPKPLSLALVSVRLKACGGGQRGGGVSGTMSDLARIYSRIEQDQDEASDKVLTVNELKNRKLIGFITTGKYSMRLGYSHGIGAVSLIEFAKMQIRQIVKLKGGNSCVNSVWYRNVHEQQLRMGNLTWFDK
ncbi:hypothetical protein CROQUDRAFT_657523 [Cronartium quercuum f. sp. fusiforme G11]|uniref:Uncharacterized protein n=1 Tax=Cronartium quercuum f. sp. fusiforme G11 TaxID=708437 RepID=A0A9P6TBK3_9BASI|nr:hypothetical protein CROQUDRAFT_657523 [Cronartium quercuum f. sp. fusiforme G11]